MAFREDFVWGAASSAYQTEGFPSADGGGESIWDAFCRRPGAIANGDNGSIACDGYHRFEEDIRLLSSLGLRAYRFSTSWARIDPNGDGRWNEAGLQYYDRVVDRCLANGVTPWMTLYHWELPQALEEKGGWQNCETVERFAQFAGMMAAHSCAREAAFASGTRFVLEKPHAGAWAFLPGHPERCAGSFDRYCLHRQALLSAQPCR